MTLVIAEEEAGRVWMGADSSAGSRDEVYAFPDLDKVVRRGPYLVGHCGNGHVGQLASYGFEWPEPPRAEDLLPFLARDVVPAFRQAVLDAGAGRDDEALLGDKTVLLIGLRGKLFALAGNLYVLPVPGPVCVGAGRHHGYGAIHALKAAGVEPARKRIEMALQSAAETCLYVRPPFRILEASGKKA